MNISQMSAVSSGKFAFLSILLVFALCSPAFAQHPGPDRGPVVTIEGTPAAPCDVIGHLERIEDDDSTTIIRQGSTVAMTVSSESYGSNMQEGHPELNRIAELALYSTKVASDVIPFRPGGDANLAPGEATHTPYGLWNSTESIYQNETPN